MAAAQVNPIKGWHWTSKIGGAIGKKRVVAGAVDCEAHVDMQVVDQSVSHWAHERNCSLCPLNRVKAGLAVRIKRLCASPQVASRLRELGFGEEQIIRLITSQANVICLVCNARMAISAQLAQAILVEPLFALET
jgi:Fe2+ transport system protein FeoA